MKIWIIFQGMADQHVYVCMPWDQQRARRLDREKGRKPEASPIAKEGIWARKENEERGQEVTWDRSMIEQTDKRIEKTTQARGKLAWRIHRRLCVKTWTIIGWRKPEKSSSGNRSKEHCYRELLPYQCLALNCFSAFFHSPQITMESANSVSYFLSILSPFKGGF